MPLVLVVTHAGLAGEYPVLRDLTIGRAPENEVVLTAADVSRRHAQVRPVTSGYRVTDLGSANGTRLNGEPVEPHTPVELNAGDALSFGGVTIDVVDRPVRLRYPDPSPTHGGTRPSLPPQPQRLEAELVVTTAAGECCFPLAGEVVSLGRGFANTINIEHASVSTRHALLVRTATSYRIEDRGSTNGLTVNGVRVLYHDLAPGDMVQIGDSVCLEYRTVSTATFAPTKTMPSADTQPGTHRFSFTLFRHGTR